MIAIKASQFTPPVGIGPCRKCQMRPTLGAGRSFIIAHTKICIDNGPLVHSKTK
jgi:hypothetical protein